MELKLNGLLPLPLREKIAPNSSDVWLQQVSLSHGQRIFIQAPSGTGKSTFMSIIYGLRNDYEGEATWEGADIKNMEETQLARLRAGYLSIVFQDMRLFPDLTAMENLEIKRTLTPSVTADAAENMLYRLGIADKRNALARTLSYGEQQRVAIARALLQPFDWLLMDEPFSHLDQMNIEKAAGLIQEVVEKNNAGILLADLEPNNLFPYHRVLYL